jgi:hypothetical protein
MSRLESNLPEREVGVCTRASFALFALCSAILLADVLGVLFLSSGRDIISSRLHDQLQIVALLSLPLVLLLSLIGFVLALIDFVNARSGAPRRGRFSAPAMGLNLIWICAFIALALYVWWGLMHFAGA